MKILVLASIVIASSAGAQVVPIPSRDDARLQTVRYTPDQPVRLQTAPGNDLTVILAPGERISNFIVDNHTAYQIRISEARDSFVLHASMTPPQEVTSGDATLSIATDRRTYEFLLTSVPSGAAPYVLRFTYRGSERTHGGKSSAHAGQYKLTGNKALRPASIRDDGSKMYIRWDPDQAIPAVFALNRIGREEMVDGYMRDGVFTIDRVHDRLVFRIDDAKAEATRSKGSSPK